MKRIVLTQGKYALVDDADFEELNRFKWYARKRWNTFYATRMSPWINGKRVNIQMHHEVIGRPSNGFVNDHVNGNGLDNRRKNLRHVTIRQNQQNQKNGCNSSEYPGVCWATRDKRWITGIVIKGKRKHLGYFKTELEAFIAYKQAVEAIGEEVLS